jgi:hypothetical protein
MTNLISSPLLCSKHSVSFLRGQRLFGQIRCLTPAFDPIHHSHNHFRPPSSRIPIVAGNVWPVLASVLVAASIVYAPLHSFDDLDCLSYCQQYCVDGGRRDK